MHMHGAPFQYRFHHLSFDSYSYINKKTCVGMQCRKWVVVVTKGVSYVFSDQNNSFEWSENIYFTTIAYFLTVCMYIWFISLVLLYLSSEACQMSMSARIFFNWLCCLLMKTNLAVNHWMTG